MNMLALTIIFPLIGFVLLAFSRGRWSENLSATVGMGSVGLAALVTAYVGVDFFATANRRSACRCGPGCRSVISTSASTWCWMACR
jgi:NADH:ubiquinone oxidoreductase subunit 5 (subunit L)/multisubunit Na+/H+ antiporter MnhA subunit